MPSSAEIGRAITARRFAPGQVGGGALAWLAVAALLLLGSLACIDAPPAALEWQPGLAWQQPWRAWTAAWVHYSALHLLANIIGGLLVVALGLVARATPRAALAWLIAWPLTQLGLVWRPDLLHYGGLSGVLHAGVAVVAVELLVHDRGPRRWIGAAILVGVAAKVLLEGPLGPPLRHPAGWDIAVAPFAHLCGLVAGASASLAASLAPPRTIAADG